MFKILYCFLLLDLACPVDLNTLHNRPSNAVCSPAPVPLDDRVSEPQSVAEIRPPENAFPITEQTERPETSSALPLGIHFRGPCTSRRSLFPPTQQASLSLDGSGRGIATPKYGMSTKWLAAGTSSSPMALSLGPLGNSQRFKKVRLSSYIYFSVFIAFSSY